MDNENIEELTANFNYENKYYFIIIKKMTNNYEPSVREVYDDLLPLEHQIKYDIGELNINCEDEYAKIKPDLEKLKTMSMNEFLINIEEVTNMLSYDNYCNKFYEKLEEEDENSPQKNMFNDDYVLDENNIDGIDTGRFYNRKFVKDGYYQQKQDFEDKIPKKREWFHPYPIEAGRDYLEKSAVYKGATIGEELKDLLPNVLYNSMLFNEVFPDLTNDLKYNNPYYQFAEFLNDDVSLFWGRYEGYNDFVVAAYGIPYSNIPKWKNPFSVLHDCFMENMKHYNYFRPTFVKFRPRYDLNIPTASGFCQHAATYYQNIIN